jgi:hypothetical protein
MKIFKVSFPWFFEEKNYVFVEDARFFPANFSTDG